MAVSAYGLQVVVAVCASIGDGEDVIYLRRWRRPATLEAGLTQAGVSTKDALPDLLPLMAVDLPDCFHRHHHCHSPLRVLGG